MTTQMLSSEISENIVELKELKDKKEYDKVTYLGVRE